MKTPLVSIIVPTYNEEAQIENCLTSIRSQTYSNIEIIVVNSERTSDKTALLARKFTKKVYKFGRERSMQRNFGAKKAEGEYLLFIDADMKLGKNVVEECVNAFHKNKNLGGVIIAEKSYGESYWARCKALERNCYIGDETIEAARFYPKKLFLEAGGYEENMISGEDWNLSNKIKLLGKKVGRVKSLIMHNEGKLSLLKDIKKKLYYSQKSDEYLSSRKLSLKDIILFVLRPAYFRNWKMLLGDPVHLVGMIVMKFLEFLIGGIIILPKTKYLTGFVILLLFLLALLAVKNSFSLALSGDDWLMHWMTWSIFHIRKITSIWNPLSWLCTYCPHYPTLNLMRFFFGFEPFYYYLLSLVTRALAAVTIYFILRSITKSIILAVLAGAIFAVGYPGIETTDWVFNFVHYLGIPAALIFLWFYYQAKKKLKLKAEIIAALFFLLALIISPPRMHGLYPLVLTLELVWVLIEGRKYNFKHGLVRIVLLFILYRALFVWMGDLTLFLRDRGIDITSGHDVYGYGDPAWLMQRIKDGIAKATMALSTGRSDFLLYPIIAVGNYVVPESVLASIPFAKFTFMGRSAFSFLTYSVPIVGFLAASAFFVFRNINARLSHYWTYFPLLIGWALFIKEMKRLNISTFSDSQIAFALIGGAITLFTIYLFFIIKDKKRTIAEIILLGLAWMYTFGLFPWILEPLSVLTPSGRYSIQQLVGLAFWVSALFYILFSSAKKGVVTKTVLVLFAVFYLFIHFNSTDKYLAQVKEFRNKELDAYLWQTITTDIPTIPKDAVSVVYLTYEPTDYLVAEWAIRFGFPSRASLYYQITDQNKTPFVIMGNYGDLVSVVTDGERLAKQGLPKDPVVKIDNVYAFHLRDKKLKNVTEETRQKLSEEPKSF